MAFYSDNMSLLNPLVYFIDFQGRRGHIGAGWCLTVCEKISAKAYDPHKLSGTEDLS